MLKQIALKNHLSHKYKLQNDIALMNEAKNTYSEILENVPATLKIYYRNK